MSCGVNRSCVPGLPDAFGADPEALLFEPAAHGDVQAVIMAAMNVAPHLDRAAFTESTTIADVVAWIGPDVAVLDGDGGTGPVERPRGSYAGSTRSSVVCGLGFCGLGR